MANWFTRAFRQTFGLGRTAPDDPYRLATFMPTPHLPAGIHLTMDSALQIAAVWACVDAISKAISSSRWLVQTRDAKGRRKILFDDPVAYLLNVRPNKDMSAIGFREAIMFSCLTYGNGYAEIVRDGAGRVAELQFLLPDLMTPRRLSRDEGYRLIYEYRNPFGSELVRLEAEDVLHVHGPGVSGLMGDNIVARAAKSMAVAAAQERFASTYFGNNTVIGGWLEYPKVLSDEAYDRMRKSWEDTHKGPDKAHKIAILENGTTYHPHEANAESSQLSKAREFQIEEICRFYGVPPHKIQHLARATFSNIEHLSIEWVRDGITPWARRLEQEADYKLFSSRSLSRSTKIDTAWLSYGDAKSRADFYKTMREMGVYSVNEIREREGDNDIGQEGDVRMVPMNMMTLEQLRTMEEKAELELTQMGEEPDDDTEGQDEAAETPEEEEPFVANRALVAMFCASLERYSNRLKRRADDLRANAPDKLEANLAKERERLRPWLLSECAEARRLLAQVSSIPIDDSVIYLSADAVDNGKAARGVSEQLVSWALGMGGGVKHDCNGTARGATP